MRSGSILKINYYIIIKLLCICCEQKLICLKQIYKHVHISIYIENLKWNNFIYKSRYSQIKYFNFPMHIEVISKISNGKWVKIAEFAVEVTELERTHFPRRKYASVPDRLECDLNSNKHLARDRFLGAS